ncbi:MAG: hypothetical protein E7234_06100 [Lachnospiraceae bacterium]|nr:hypothetical protein [Lachnospiraceae bacterium]
MEVQEYYIKFNVPNTFTADSSLRKDIESILKSFLIERTKGAIKAVQVFDTALKQAEIASEEELKTDFESIWELYPNKKGKKAAFAAYKKAVKSGTSHEDIEQGIIKYANYIKAHGIQEQFIKYGGSWFSGMGWENDYAISKPKNKHKNRFDNFSGRERTPEYYKELERREAELLQQKLKDKKEKGAEK